MRRSQFVQKNRSRTTRSILSPTLPALFCLFLFACENVRPTNAAPAAEDNDKTTLPYEELVETNAAARLNQEGDSALFSGDSARIGRTYLNFYRQSIALHDSLFTTEKTRNIQELEALYQIKEKEMEISLLQARQQAEVARRNLLLALLSLSIAVTGGLLFGWRENQKRSQRVLSEHRQKLHECARLLMVKNTQLTKLKEALVAMKTDSTEIIDPGTGLIRSSLAIQSEDFDQHLYNSRILTDSDWEVFKNYFEHGNPGYLHRLRSTFPNLSGAEERLFLLVKLNFNSNEAAATLGISKDSIKKGRQRLRKRLEMKTKENLDQFVQSF